MPISVTCPNCQTTLKAPDQAAGRKVKCPRCATAFGVPDVSGAAPSVAPPAIQQSSRPLPPAVHPVSYAPPDDDDYDRPQRSRREFVHGEGAPSVGAQVGLGIASLVVGIIGLLIAFIPCIGLFIGLPVAAIGLVLGVAALIVAFVRGGQGLAFPISGSAVSLVAVIVPFIWWYVWVRPMIQTASQRVQQQAQQGFQNIAKQMEEQVKKAQQVQADMNRWQPGVGGVQLVLNQQDRLTDADPKDRSRNTPSKTYNFKMEAGKSYQFNMISAEFDCYLRLEDANGEQLVVSFAGGFGTECRITYFCQRDDNYRIIATRANNLRGRTGSFVLTVLQK